MALFLLLFELLNGGGGVGVLCVGCKDVLDCWLAWDENVDDI